MVKYYNYCCFEADIILLCWIRVFKIESHKNIFLKEIALLTEHDCVFMMACVLQSSWSLKVPNHHDVFLNNIITSSEKEKYKIEYTVAERIYPLRIA